MSQRFMLSTFNSSKNDLTQEEFLAQYNSCKNKIAKFSFLFKSPLALNCIEVARKEFWMENLYFFHDYESFLNNKTHKNFTAICKNYLQKTSLYTLNISGPKKEALNQLNIDFNAHAACIALEDAIEDVLCTAQITQFMSNSNVTILLKNMDVTVQQKNKKDKRNSLSMAGLVLPEANKKSDQQEKNTAKQAGSKQSQQFFQPEKPKKTGSFGSLRELKNSTSGSLIRRVFSKK